MVRPGVSCGRSSKQVGHDMGGGTEQVDRGDAQGLQGMAQVLAGALGEDGVEDGDGSLVRLLLDEGDDLLGGVDVLSTLMGT